MTPQLFLHPLLCVSSCLRACRLVSDGPPRHTCPGQTRNPAPRPAPTSLPRQPLPPAASPLLPPLACPHLPPRGPATWRCLCHQGNSSLGLVPLRASARSSSRLDRCRSLELCRHPVPPAARLAVFAYSSWGPQVCRGVLRVAQGTTWLDPPVPRPTPPLPLALALPTGGFCTGCSL